MRFQTVAASQGGFTEWGAQSLNLAVQQQNTTSVRTVLGADLAASIPLGTERALGITLRLGWAHEYADTARPMTAAFAGAPTVPFTAYGAQPMRGSAVIGSGSPRRSRPRRRSMPATMANSTVGMILTPFPLAFA